MKLKNLKKSKKYPNLELQVIKLHSKKKNFKPKTEIKLTETLLRKIANVMYFYHVSGKTILFIGFPVSFNKNLKTTKHFTIPEFLWQNNMFNSTINLSNSSKNTKLPKNIFKLKTKLKKKVDLIVINGVDKNKIALKESYLTKIPSITLTGKHQITENKYSYNSMNSYNFFTEKEENKNFFFLFVKTVLLRAKKFKRLSDKTGNKKIKNIF